MRNPGETSNDKHKRINILDQKEYDSENLNDNLSAEDCIEDAKSDDNKHEVSQ
jgi:hypothetical protein